MNSINGGSSRVRVSIPNNVRKTIQHIREITGKQHTDDEIYAVLRECSMDPNDTAQKLLYLDTFHEVTRRRDRKKEGLSSGDLEDSRMKQGGKGRGGRIVPSGYSSKFSDGGGGRNLASRRENGISQIAERSRECSTQPVSQKIKQNPTSQSIRVSVVASNGAVSQSNGNSGCGFSDQSLIGSGISVPKSSSAVNDTNNAENVQPQVAVAAAFSPITTSGSVTSIDQGKSLSNSDQPPTSASVSGVYSSFSDPVLASSISQNHGISSAINREIGSQRIYAGSDLVQGNKNVLHEVVDLPSPKSKRSDSMNSTSKDKAPNKSNETEKNMLFDTSKLLSSLSCNGSLRSPSSSGNQPPPVNASKASDVLMESSAELRQHVTFPNHFQVPETLKAGLTFGSFDNFGSRERHSSGTGGDNNTSAALTSSAGSDETATSSHLAPVSAQGDHIEYPYSSSNLIEKTQAPRNTITVFDSNSDQPKQEVLLASDVLPIQNVQNAQNYGLNFIPTMLGTQQVHFDGAEPQAQETSHLPNFVSASSQAVSSSSPTPPLQSSIPVSPQSIPIFRPPYPPNFFPYGHFYPPIYLSPMHQFLIHNGFPPHPSAGNIYLPPPAAGIKYPLPQFKAGANNGAAHIGIPPASFIAPPAGYIASPTVNTGSSNGNEDLAASQLKENHIHTTGQLSEGSTVWIPAPGQDISHLQLSSLYNLSPQGHFAFPPTQIYQPGQMVASPSTLLQQSQAVAGPVETVGPPSGAYQQPQHAQINWNSNS
ncbi:PREDICTED: GBF-interacting protein 1-like isoform X2 [Lupinus angustifolius]|uniref:GBF-interacting protein 1-like isoform X2 n=1 Tax=Lupinus angustifolius TaxID=3871 RepID=UPI00092E9D42|nr:PREDICTED: GBF-interacting protein 1-like isoform X2 [Lupinus angustifolius]